jgi:hypothetical protein
MAELDAFRRVKSAIVRTTFKMRSWTRAERPSRVMAFFSNFSPSAVTAQYFRIIFGIICAFE